MKVKKNGPKDIVLTIGYTLLMVVFLSLWTTAFTWVDDQFGAFALLGFMGIGAPLYLTAVYLGFEAIRMMRVEQHE
jgi:hypothetical protein